MFDIFDNILPSFVVSNEDIIGFTLENKCN